MEEEIINSKDLFETVRKYYILFPELRSELYNILYSNNMVPLIVFDDNKILESIRTNIWRAPMYYINTESDIVWLLSRFLLKKHIEDNF